MSSFLINPYRYATLGFVGDFSGAQLKKTSDETAANYSAAGYGTALSWDSLDFDTNSFFAGGAPTRITIPAELNGYYVVLSAQVQLDDCTGSSTASLAILKSGAEFNGTGCNLASTGGGPDGTANRAWVQARTHPFQVSTGDYFEAFLHSSDASITVEADNCYFSIYVIGPTIQGALIKPSVDRATQNYSAAPAISWDAEVYDSDAFHDLGVNPTRLTVPAAYNGRYAIIKSTVHLGAMATSTQSNVHITKGGVGAGTEVIATVQNVQNGAAASTVKISTETAPILVSTGDYFEHLQFSADTSTTLIAGSSAFSIQILPTTFKGVLCKLNAAATADYTTPTALAWDGTDIYDTDSAHDPSSNNTKIIIPSAWNNKYAIFTMAIHGTNLTANQTTSVGIKKGGSTVYNGFGGYSAHNGNSSGPGRQATSGIVKVATGEEYTGVYYNTTDTSSTAGISTTFSCRILNP